jgi:DNA-binding transcriptional regulator YiaG
MIKLPKMTPIEMETIRDKLNLSRPQMASRLGVTARTYQRWASGDRTIPGPAVLLAQRILRDHENVNKLGTQ